ncbi:proteasome subunit beta [Vibrio phage vB_VhaP_PG11]|nr:proteasome subunit beta [Vibrio phage vB_VhaP_PG11]
MTTIVYDHLNQTVTADSRVTSGGFVNSDDYEKCWITPEYVFWFAGVFADIQTVVENYPCGFEGAPECSGFVFYRKTGEFKSIGWSSEREYQCELEWNEAIGSGEHFALAALDMGATPEEAVAYAATRDTATGGVIRHYKLEDYLVFED